MKRKYFIFVFLFLLGTSFLFCQNKFSDSLLKKISETNNDSLKCCFLQQLIENEYDNTVWPSYNVDLKAIAKKYINSPNTNQRLFFLEQYADAITNEGYLKQQNRNYAEAFSDFKKSLAIEFDINDRIGVANNLNNIGFIYFGIADYEKAANYYFKCIKIQQELKDETGVAISYINISNVFLLKGDTIKAIDYTKKSLSIRERLNDKIGVGNCYNNLASILNSGGHYEEALVYCNKALAIHKAIGNKNGLGNTYNNLGGLFFRLGNNKMTLEYLQTALKINKEIKDNNGTSISLLRIGKLYEKDKNYLTAKDYYKEALKFAKSSIDIREIKNAAERLYLINKIVGNRKEEQEAYKLFSTLKDSINKRWNIKLEDDLADSLNAPFENTVNPEKENKKESYEWTNLNIILIISISLVSVVLFLIFRNRKP